LFLNATTTTAAAATATAAAPRLALGASRFPIRRRRQQQQQQQHHPSRTSAMHCLFPPSPLYSSLIFPFVIIRHVVMMTADIFCSYEDCSSTLHALLYHLLLVLYGYHYFNKSC
jgi:hypothetical protein